MLPGSYRLKGDLHASDRGRLDVLCVFATVSLARAWLLESAHASIDCRRLTIEMKPGGGQGVLMVRMPTSVECMRAKKYVAHNSQATLQVCHNTQWCREHQQSVCCFAVHRCLPTAMVENQPLVATYTPCCQEPPACKHWSQKHGTCAYGTAAKLRIIARQMRHIVPTKAAPRTCQRPAWDTRLLAKQHSAPLQWPRPWQQLLQQLCMSSAAVAQA